MQDPYPGHPSEEQLERFILRHSPEEELEAVETHILACESCVEQLEALELQMSAVRLALQQIEEKRTRKALAKSSAGWRNWLSVPVLAGAGAFACLALTAVTLSIPRDVTLSAYRGSEMAIVSEWRPLNMHLNAADLTDGPVTVELVDNSGSLVWRGSSAVRHDKVDVALPRITRGGPHFLRLYTQAQGNGEAELLREYSIQVKF